MPKVVLTGYGPYISAPTNPSEMVVRAIENRTVCPEALALLPPCRIITQILPVTTEAQMGINTLWDQHGDVSDSAFAFIHLGVDPEATEFHIECIGLNVLQHIRPDANGITRPGDGVALVNGGPLALQSTLGSSWLAEQLGHRGISASVSWHAGTYFCNLAFFKVASAVIMDDCSF
ncbi:hypothetical protein Pelo_14976 [Pelomyxa schiedti]|nr:hypothetical protein Pelo_14976 [Pelomyxa schiedti]